jgi:hypothetical protein
MLMTSSRVTKSDGKKEVKVTLRLVAHCTLADQSVGSATGVDGKITFASSSPNVFLMRMLYSHK